MHPSLAGCASGRQVTIGASRIFDLHRGGPEIAKRGDMITIAIVVILSLLLIVLTIIDRRTDRFFMPRLAVICGLVCAAATVLFDALTNY
jgi:hypothetical protein